MSDTDIFLRPQWWPSEKRARNRERLLAFMENARVFVGSWASLQSMCAFEGMGVYDAVRVLAEDGFIRVEYGERELRCVTFIHGGPVSRR
jgi:hypothetical protein